MPIEHPVTQGSEAWLRIRLGRPTASEFDNLITPEFKQRSGQMPETYLFKKLAEAIMGKSLEEGGAWAMEQGSLLESEALPWFEFTTDIKVRRIGFVTTDDMRIGCSPDGLIGDDGGIEIKCPLPHTHLKYLIAGTVPKDYLAQVHGCMFVTGRAWWNFLSYSRHFPPLLIRVERDERIQAILSDALMEFLDQFDIAQAKIEALQKK